MKMLEDRIRKDGIVREGNVLKVDSFINHQMDIPLFREMAKEWKRLFAGKPINKVLTIEAEPCLMMAEKEILPASMKFAGATAKAVNAMKTAGVEPYAEAHVLADVAERNAKLYKALEGLRGAVKATCHGDALECAKYEHNVIIPAMAAVREQADELETLVGKEYWPFPTYDDLLFNV